jgi:hypothetical protein
MKSDNRTTKTRQDHDFGNIPICPDPSLDKAGQGEKIPRKPGPTTPEKNHPHPTRRKFTPRTDRRKKSGFRLCLWLLLIPAACALASGYLLVPQLVRGPLADRVSRLLDRPVSIESVFFSPLTMQLHLAGITLGPLPNTENSRILGTIDSVDSRLRPAALFKGRIVLQNTSIKGVRLNLARIGTGEYNFPVQDIFSATPPKWLVLHGINISDSRITLHDLPAKRVHELTDIELCLPVPGNPAGEIPFVSAVLDKSRILIQGETNTPAGSHPGSRFSLQLTDIDPARYLAYLPGETDDVSLAGGRATITLELILPDGGHTLSGLIVRGNISGSDLVVENGRKDSRVVLPALHMNIEALPLKKMFAVKTLGVQGPRLILQGNPADRIAAMRQALAKWLRSSDVALTVDQLVLDQGTMTGTNTWQNLRLRLLNFANTAAVRHSTVAPEPASLEFSLQGKSRIDFHGTLSEDLVVKGDLTMDNMERTDLQALLFPEGACQFSKGSGQLAGQLRAPALQNDQEWELDGAQLTLNDFLLRNDSGTMARGRRLSATDCSKDAGDDPLQCREVIIHDTDFNRSAVRASIRKLFSGTNRFSAEVIRLKNCSADISPATGEKKKKNLKLHKLNLVLQQNRLQMEAQTGEEGKIALSGPVDSPDAQLQLTGAGIDLGQLVPGRQIKNGKLALNGTVVPAKKNFSGSFSITGFKARQPGLSIGMNKITARNCKIYFAPLEIHARSIVFSAPSITAGPAVTGLQQALFSIFTPQDNRPAVLPLEFSSCSISSGRLKFSGFPTDGRYLPSLDNIRGRIALERSDTPGKIELAGRMDGAEFSLWGAVTDFTLTVRNFDLSLLKNELLHPMKCCPDSGTASWTLAPAGDNGTVTLTGLRPEPGSEFSLILGLLMDNEDTFTLPLSATQHTMNPAATVSKAIVDQLNRLRLQSVISPQLVLSRFLPELDLPDSVEFLPGESVPDFMAEPDDYQTLLKLRPHLGLTVQGHFDEQEDKQRLIDILQEAADAERELTNIRREQERSRLLAAEELRLAALAARGKPVDRRTIQAIEQREDLQPLAPVRITLPDQALENLAGQRARFIVDYLTRTLAIPADKIEILPPASGGARVSISLVYHRQDRPQARPLP